MRRLRAGRTLEIVARDVRLSAASADKLMHIAERYFGATRRRLVVTGGTRPPLRQAELMYEKLRNREDIVALYENQYAALEIRNAYQQGVAMKHTRKRILGAMRDVIEAQIGRGVFVSKHLQSGAIDVRSRTMSRAQEAALRAAVASEPGATLLDERGSAEPHFHLSL